MFNFSKIEMKPRYATGYKPGVTDDQISELEEHYGHMLPENYKFILKNYHGGCPEAKNFGVVDKETGVPLGYELINFMIVDEHTAIPLNIWWKIENYSDLLGPDTFPFADNDYNHIYYLKWNNDETQVWLLKFLSEDEPETYFLMSSFDELLDALYSED